MPTFKIVGVFIEENILLVFFAPIFMIDHILFRDHPWNEINEKPWAEQMANCPLRSDPRGVKMGKGTL